MSEAEHLSEVRREGGRWPAGALEAMPRSLGPALSVGLAGPGSPEAPAGGVGGQQW